MEHVLPPRKTRFYYVHVVVYLSMKRKRDPTFISENQFMRETDGVGRFLFMLKQTSKLKHRVLGGKRCSLCVYNASPSPTMYAEILPAHYNTHRPPHGRSFYKIIFVMAFVFQELIFLKWEYITRDWERSSQKGFVISIGV